MKRFVLAFFVAFVIQTTSALWPQPQSMVSTGEMYTVDKSNFAFTTSVQNNYVLNEALIRYNSLLFDDMPLNPANYSLLNRLSITIANPSAPLGPDTDESYALVIAAPVSVLEATSVYGVLRGLETFSQLVKFNRTLGNYVVGGAQITDAPRFSFRGILIDTSRHYYKVNVIHQFLDAMAYSKFNVLHWHIVDDQSFPYVSQTYPKLAQMGAWKPYDTHVYTPGDVQSVIEYAALRGIRVIPEFDTPAHATSWTKGYPEIGTVCYQNGQPVLNSSYVPFNPIKTSTYTFLRNLFKEVGNTFPDPYIHLGGDEVPFGCWASNPDIQKFMSERGWGTQFNLLEQYYETQLVQIIASLSKRYVVWEDVFDNGVKLDPETIIAIWQSGWENTMQRVTAAGYQAILYAPWYLNYISYGDDWTKYYQVNPTNFNGTAAQKELIIGGSATFWSEFIDATNLISRAWPRSAAIGERLWSPESVNDVNEAAGRIHEFRCLLLRRSINAEPIVSETPCNEEYEVNYISPWLRG